MALRDVNRADAVTSANDSSYCFPGRIFVHERHPAAGFRGQSFMRADQNAFCAADRWPVQKNTEVCSESHSAWVSVALAITKKQIWHPFQFFQGREKRGNLAKTQEAGDIRKLKRHDCMRALDFHQIWKTEHDYAANGTIGLAQRIPSRDFLF